MSGLTYNFPNTGSLVRRDDDQGQTTTGLSTQIIIRVNNVAVGALQSLTVNQNRGLSRINEIGTDGNIEIVPNQSPTYDLQATRIVFDQLRLPEAFSRAFRIIGAQRMPFDIDIFDIGNTTPAAVVGTSAQQAADGVIVTRFSNCWFASYSTPYNATDYVITENATIWAETAFVANEKQPSNLRSISPQTDAETRIEEAVNIGKRRGSMDVSGLVNSIFE